MAIQQKLQTRLSQKLVLTPSLQQAIKLLPMSTLELVDLLNQEVVENPLLEEIPDEGLPAAEPAEQAAKAAAEGPDTPEAAPAAERQDAWEDADYEYFFGDYLDDGYRSRTPTEFKELPPIENTLSAGTSLSEHLLRQLGEQTDDDRQREIGSAIIGNLDENGYLVASIEEIASMGPWPLAEIERTLDHVQTLDPIGIAARDLRECLLLQIRHRTDTTDDLIGKEAVRENLIQEKAVGDDLIGKEAAKDIKVSRRTPSRCKVSESLIGKEAAKDIDVSSPFYSKTHRDDCTTVRVPWNVKPVILKTRTVVKAGNRVTRANVEELHNAGIENIEIVEIIDVTVIAAGKEITRATVAELRRAGIEKIEIIEIAFVPHNRCRICETIVREHLSLLQNGHLPDLARRLGVSIDILKDHVERLRQLDPKPGSRLNPVESRYVIPDVSVIKVEDEFVAVLNDERVPQLRISPVYRRMMSKGSQSSEETRAYVKKKFESAKWLIKSVDQRQRTIRKVATSIIRFQRGFLDHGIEHLRPLVLRDVANDIGMHESTVSRVVTNKYMHTPQGVFEMKYFFHSGIHSSYGENVSSVKVKQRIRKIIAREDARKPLSDSRIVRLLQEEGLVLARRTIAKYREELKIPTSSRRRVHY